MKNYSQRNLLLFVFAVSVFSCGKDYDSGSVLPSDTPGPYTLQSAMASVAVKPKVVTLNAADGGSFNGESGTRYIFPPNSFVSSTGEVIDGDVQVTVSEYLTKVDMLFSGVLPLSNGTPLISGGEVNVEAMRSGQEIKMDAGKEFTINMPQKGTPVAGMELFTGNMDSSTNSVSWTPASSTSGSLGYMGDTISVSSANLHFINADGFYNNPIAVKININLEITGVSMNDSFLVYCLVDSVNSVYPLARPVAGTITNGNALSRPMHLAALGVINGNLYGGIIAITPTNEATYAIPLSKTTPSSFKSQLGVL